MKYGVDGGRKNAEWRFGVLTRATAKMAEKLATDMGRR